MIRRHPHVFGDARADDPEAVSAQWEHIKRTVENRSHESIVGGVPRDFPSLLRAVKMSRKAARAGFDWEGPEQVLEKVEEEISELKEAMSEGQPGRVEHELGDTLLALANLARFLQIDPEVAMISANDRFERRFREMEKIALKTGITIEQSDMRTLDRLWDMAKKATSSEQ
jgi:MazG family protein